MIRLVSDNAELDRALSGAPDIYAEKIRSLSAAYGLGYPFCRFWVQDSGAVISGYYDSGTVASPCERIDRDDAEELAAFLCCGQFTRLLMPYPLCEKLGLAETAEKTHLMVYPRSAVKYDDIDKDVKETDISLDQIYEIAASGFDIDRDKWYTDTSHLLRHGSAGFYLLDGSACAVRMFSSDGISYISYVCTRPEKRGLGLAKRLLRHICARECAENGAQTFIFCKDELRQFYEDTGFTACGLAADIETQMVTSKYRFE